ncbi:MAG: GIY-YIG nuclease family protein [Actinomycetota bacterium]|nr:GIY-YIG nuclease family protein [Actinomycetota bacterium]
MTEKVGIAEIAKRLKVDGTTVRRLIARESEVLQLELHRGKGDKLLLSQEDADKLVASYEARRGPISTAEDAIKFDRYGYFYIIQLVPEVLPNRIKIGFADNVEKRLNEHQTSAPTARLLKAWPCKRSWDYVAMDSVTRDGCKLVLNEVYEGDIEGFLSRGDEFFSLMPNPDSEKQLSEHSPLYEPGGNND